MGDVLSVEAVVSFDSARRTARVEAEMLFTGRVVFDLRQQVSSGVLDGTSVGVPHVDMGGGPGAEVRVIERHLAEDESEHSLLLSYELATPVSEGAVPLGWATTVRPTVVWDLWMSDLWPGRYLEMWLPAPLIHDPFRLILHLEGLDDDYVVLANGSVEGPAGMTVRYPDHYTALSHFLLVAPRERVEMVASEALVTCKLAGPELDLEAGHGAVAGYLEGTTARFGPYCHSSEWPFVAYLYGSSRSMEYDGATSSAMSALHHETFHSWFGRGLKPAHASDGWIDEAFTTWFTADPPRRARWAEPFDLDQAPVVLRPSSPWARFTPRESYTEGARFFAGLADVFGGVDELCDAMAAWYSAAPPPRLVTTDELQAFLSEASSVDLAPYFGRFVHGRAD